MAALFEQAARLGLIKRPDRVASRRLFLAAAGDMCGRFGPDPANGCDGAPVSGAAANDLPAVAPVQKLSALTCRSMF